MVVSFERCTEIVEYSNQHGIAKTVERFGLTENTVVAYRKQHKKHLAIQFSERYGNGIEGNTNRRSIK